MLDYFRLISGKAGRRTVDFFGWGRDERDWFYVCLSIIVLVMTAITGFVAIALDRSFLGLLMIGISVLAVPAVTLWNFFVAAFEVDQDLRAELEALKKKPEWLFDETVARSLQKLLDEGNALIDSHTFADKRPPHNVWVEDLVSWCTRAQDFVANNLARSEAIGFSSISVFPSGEHSGAQLQNILRLRHNKLRLIAVRYMEAAPGP